jgi:CPA1 family monovalent cation:H+ antiporter
VPKVIAWAGPRGVVTLATALALPLTTDAGDPFPHRDLIIFLAFAVILATLVGQGLTLPWLIRRLDFPETGSSEVEMGIALRELTLASIQRIDELSVEEWTPKATLSSLRTALTQRLSTMSDDFEDVTQDDDPATQKRAIGDIFRAGRHAIRAMRDRGEISNETVRLIERDLDAMEARAVR